MDHQRVADWSGLTQRLESSGAGRLELPFAEIERLIGGRLPPSSQYPAFWSNGSSYAKAWKRAGGANGTITLRWHTAGRGSRPRCADLAGAADQSQPSSTISYMAGAIAHSLIVLSAIGLLARAGGGLYVIAAVLILALVRALSDIWILFTRIEEAAVTDLPPR